MPSAGPCDKCTLHLTANTVNIAGRGSETDVDILVVGEAPGTQEDQNGLPFIGPSGQLLHTLMLEAGVDVDRVRWTNINRCVPWSGTPGYGVRPPSDDERAACRPYLDEEIVRYNPKIIIAVGGTSCKALTGKGKITQARGKKFELKIFDQHTFTVIPTIHPAAVLRGNEGYRTDILADMAYIAKLVGHVRGEQVDYGVLNDLPSVETYCNWLLEQHRAGNLPCIAVDVESTTKDYIHRPEHRLLTIQIAHAKGGARLIPVSHRQSNFLDSTSMQALKSVLTPVFKEIPVVGHNYRFDFAWIYAKLGIVTEKVIFDTMLAHTFAHSRDLPSDLKYMASRYVGMGGYENELEQALAALGVGKDGMDKLDLTQMVQYACGDSDATLRLVPIVEDQLREKDLLESFHTLNMGSVWYACVWMEVNGAFIDKELLASCQESYPKKLADVQDGIKQSPFHMAFATINKRPFKLKRGQKPSPDDPEFVYPLLNPNSAKQMRQFLFEILKFERNKENTTNKAALNDMRNYALERGLEEHKRVVDLVLKYRKLGKLYSAFIKGMPNLIHDDGTSTDSRPTSETEASVAKNTVHANFNIGGAVTGRLSSSHPNLQQLPPKTDAKAMFISRWRDGGGLVVQSDYAQIEYRIFAQLANDPEMIRTFAEGRDIHRYIASRILKKPEEEVKYDERRLSKTATFAVLYGATPETVAHGRDMTVAEAEKLVEDFWAEFPVSKAWYDSQHEFARQHKYVITPTGRRRSLVKGLESGNNKDYSSAMRCAINSPVQGAASDMTLTTMGRIFKQAQQKGMASIPFAIVHDAIVYDVYPGELLPFIRLLKYEMVEGVQEQWPWITVPLGADFEVGINWGYPISCDISDDNPHYLEISGKVEHAKAVFNTIGIAHEIDLLDNEVFIEDEDQHLKIKMNLGVKATLQHPVPA